MVVALQHVGSPKRRMDRAPQVAEPAGKRVLGSSLAACGKNPSGINSVRMKDATATSDLLTAVETPKILHEGAQKPAWCTPASQEVRPGGM